MYSIHNEGKSVVTERFIKTLKTKFINIWLQYQKMCIFIVNKYNNIYHSTNKMKPVDVKSSTYIDFNKENNKEDPKFELGDHIRISEYKHIFAKGCTTNWSAEDFCD